VVVVVVVVGDDDLAGYLNLSGKARPNVSRIFSP
jgi:hypothetical protein